MKNIQNSTASYDELLKSAKETLYTIWCIVECHKDKISEASYNALRKFDLDSPSDDFSDACHICELGSEAELLARIAKKLDHDNYDEVDRQFVEDLKKFLKNSNFYIESRYFFLKEMINSYIISLNKDNVDESDSEMYFSDAQPYFLLQQEVDSYILWNESNDSYLTKPPKNEFFVLRREIIDSIKHEIAIESCSEIPLNYSKYITSLSKDSLEFLLVRDLFNKNNELNCHFLTSIKETRITSQNATSFLCRLSDLSDNEYYSEYIKESVFPAILRMIPNFDMENISHTMITLALQGHLDFAIKFFSSEDSVKKYVSKFGIKYIDTIDVILGVSKMKVLFPFYKEVEKFYDILNCAMSEKNSNIFNAFCNHDTNIKDNLRYIFNLYQNLYRLTEDATFKKFGENFLEETGNKFCANSLFHFLKIDELTIGDNVKELIQKFFNSSDESFYFFYKLFLRLFEKCINYGNLSVLDKFFELFVSLMNFTEKEEFFNFIKDELIGTDQENYDDNIYLHILKLSINSLSKTIINQLEAECSENDIVSKINKFVDEQNILIELIDTDYNKKTLSPYILKAIGEYDLMNYDISYTKDNNNIVNLKIRITIENEDIKNGIRYLLYKDICNMIFILIQEEEGILNSINKLTSTEKFQNKKFGDISSENFLDFIKLLSCKDFINFINDIITGNTEIENFDNVLRFSAYLISLKKDIEKPESSFLTYISFTKKFDENFENFNFGDDFKNVVEEIFKILKDEWKILKESADIENIAQFNIEINDVHDNNIDDVNVLNDNELELFGEHNEE